MCPTRFSQWPIKFYKKLQFLTITFADTVTSLLWDSWPSLDRDLAVKPPPPPPPPHPPPIPPQARVPQVCHKMFKTGWQSKRFYPEKKLEPNCSFQVGRVHIGHLVQLGVADFTEKWVTSSQLNILSFSSHISVNYSLAMMNLYSCVPERLIIWFCEMAWHLHILHISKINWFVRVKKHKAAFVLGLKRYKVQRAKHCFSPLGQSSKQMDSWSSMQSRSQTKGAAARSFTVNRKLSLLTFAKPGRSTLNNVQSIHHLSSK